LISCGGTGGGVIPFSMMLYINIYHQIEFGGLPATMKKRKAKAISNDRCNNDNTNYNNKNNNNYSGHVFMAKNKVKRGNEGGVIIPNRSNSSSLLFI
jgi:hypothetical protein